MRVLRSYLSFVGTLVTVAIFVSLAMMQGTRNYNDWLVAAAALSGDMGSGAQCRREARREGDGRTFVNALSCME